MKASTGKKFSQSGARASLPSQTSAMTKATTSMNKQSTTSRRATQTGVAKGPGARGAGASSFFLNSSGSTYSLYSKQNMKGARRGDNFGDVSHFVGSSNMLGASTQKNKINQQKSTRALLSTRESQTGNSFNLGSNSAMHFGRGGYRPSEDKTFMGDQSKIHAAQHGNVGNSSYFRIESEKSCFQTRMNDSSMMQQSGMRNKPRGTAAAVNTSKQSATISRHAQKLSKMNTHNFWSDLTRLAVHQNKIETIDCKIAEERGYSIQEPIEKCTIDTRQARTPRASHVRGIGGIVQEMNGVGRRAPSGSAHPEHIMAGRTMSSIVQPDMQQPSERRAYSQQQRFNKSSTMIGSNAEIFKKDPVDPASMLKPDKNFRKASVASQRNPIWVEEKDLDLISEKQKTRHEMCKLRSRERYFQSQISTLPGPQSGLSCMKTRQQDMDQQKNDNHVQKKKGYTFDKVYASHIQNLPGTHNSTQLTQEEISRQEQEKFERKRDNPHFKFNQNVLFGSYMQECMREDAGLGNSRSLSEIPSGLRSYQKGHREQNQNRTPSQVSMEARSKLLYKSNFQLA